MTTISIPKRTILTLIQSVESAAARKSAMPTLNTIQLSLAGKTLSAKATDLYLTLTASTEADGDDGFGVAIDARALLDRVKAMPDDAPVTLDASGSGQTIIKSKARRFVVPSVPISDCPTIATPKGKAIASLSADMLSSLIRRTKFSISTDETRAHVNSALLIIGDGSVRMVSTDGHRLSLAVEEFGGEAKLQALIPLNAVSALEKFLTRNAGADVAMALEFGQLFFSAGGAMLGTKLVEAQFPPYQQVIPKSVESTAKVSRAALLGAVEAVRVSADEAKGGVVFEFADGKLRLTAVSPNKGEGQDEVGCELDGKPAKVGLNAKYVADVLGACSAEEVTFGFGGELDPVVVHEVGNEADTYVVMPMRI